MKRTLDVSHSVLNCDLRFVFFFGIELNTSSVSAVMIFKSKYQVALMKAKMRVLLCFNVFVSWWLCRDLSPNPL